MNVLFICTSNKDRSPALEKYFTANYPHHNFKSAGVNKYFTTLRETHYLDKYDLIWADYFVFAEDIHEEIARRDFPEFDDLCKPEDFKRKGIKVLNITIFQSMDDYIIEAESMLRNFLEPAHIEIYPIFDVSAKSGPL